MERNAKSLSHCLLIPVNWSRKHPSRIFFHGDLAVDGKTGSLASIPHMVLAVQLGGNLDTTTPEYMLFAI
jgi:hypothetical protein